MKRIPLTKGFYAISGNEGEIVTFQEKQMSNPDSAAVRLVNKYLRDEDATPDTLELAITRECGLPQGRVLAEAVLNIRWDVMGRARQEELHKLARAYLDALDGKTS